jgi:hypothetical protein
MIIPAGLNVSMISEAVSQGQEATINLLEAHWQVPVHGLCCFTVILVNGQLLYCPTLAALGTFFLLSRPSKIISDVQNLELVSFF